MHQCSAAYEPCLNERSLREVGRVVGNLRPERARRTWLLRKSVLFHHCATNEPQTPSPAPRSSARIASVIAFVSTLTRTTLASRVIMLSL